MKLLSSTIFFMAWFMTFLATGQEITGEWSGVLNVQGIQLRLIFNVTQTEKGLTSTMDSPDQGAKGIPITQTTFENSKVKFEVDNIQMEYIGELKENEIVGTLKQNGQEFPLTLTRTTIKKEVSRRPQEPVKPYPYHSEEVTFTNKNANIVLSGTLTFPKQKGRFPTVILITGSGTQNRDEEILGHKPFLVLSDFLTKNGIAVLRYDDRGFGQPYEVSNTTPTTADLATDVESAIEYLKTRKEVNVRKIGLIGHSEGGIIAPMVAAKSKDVNFIVLLAGTGIRGDKVLLQQQELILRSAGTSDEDIRAITEINAKIFDKVICSNDSNKLKADLTEQLNEMFNADKTQQIPSGITKEEFIAKQVSNVINPWMQYFLKYDPTTALRTVKCAVLALNGEKDLQVSSKENLYAIKNTLNKSGNKKVTIMELPNLNHLFQECITGAPSEYGTIEQTFSPTALEIITQWIKKQ